MGESCTLQSKKPFKELLVNSDKILLLPLQIWLSLTMLLFKALDKDGDTSESLLQIFPCLSIAVLNAGDFDDPQICQPVRDTEVANSKNELELEEWEAFDLDGQTLFRLIDRSQGDRYIHI